MLMAVLDEEPATPEPEATEAAPEPADDAVLLVKSADGELPMLKEAAEDEKEVEAGSVSANGK